MLGLTAAVSLLFAAAGCVTTSAPPPGVHNPTGAPTALDSDPGSNGNGNSATSGSSDLLRPGDVVIVGFSGVSDPPPRVDDRIREDGKMVLPFIGPIEAAGLTRSELQRRIHDAYVGKYYTQLTVSVNPDVRYIYVDGEVQRPGNIPYQGQMSVSKAIAAAGGFTDFGNRRKVQLIRQGDKPINVNWHKAQRDPRLDLAVYPEDRIHVPRRVLW